MPCSGATGSSFPTGSSPAPRSTPRRAATTSARWPRPPTSPGPTVPRSLTAHARRSRRRLEDQGIAVRATSARGLAEEAPEAYKDVERVVAIVERAGLAARVARLRPIGVVKG